VNDAEAEGLRQGMQRVVALLEKGHLKRRPIRVLGDSQLLIRFLLGIFKKPRKPSLYQAVKEVKELVYRGRLRVSYRHVPRDLNTQADAMCRLAEVRETSVRLDASQLADQPILDLGQLYD